MKSDEYITRYICPECGNKSTIIQYGAKSDIMRMIKTIINRPFCITCGMLRKTIRMDVLDVKCVVKGLATHKYEIAWMCVKCHSRWSTTEQLKYEQRFQDLEKSKKLIKCVGANCESKPEDIRRIRIRYL